MKTQDPKSELGIYDLSRWKPVGFQEFLGLLGRCGITVNEPDTLRVELEHLPDTRMRTVIYAAVVEYDADVPHDEEQPYLLMLHEEEHNKQHCFVRSDVRLFLE